MKLGGTNQQLSLVPSVIMFVASIALSFMVINDAPAALMWVAIPLLLGAIASMVKYYVLLARKNARDDAELEQLLSSTR